MLALLSDPQAWLAFATLAILEIVLSVDNIIFISIMVSKLPHAQQRSARIGGLALAMCTRIALLYSIVWLTHLTRPLLAFAGQAFSRSITRWRAPRAARGRIWWRDSC